MNRRGVWRELWLVLTLLAICAFFASVFPVLHLLSQDPYEFLSTFTDLGWLFDQWPPGVPTAQQVLVALPFLSAFLAWQFHRFYQQALEPPAEAGHDPDDPTPPTPSAPA